MAGDVRVGEIGVQEEAVRTRAGEQFLIVVRPGSAVVELTGGGVPPGAQVLDIEGGELQGAGALVQVQQVPGQGKAFLAGELAGGEDQEVQVAVLLLEAAQGQRAVEIHRQEVRPEAALPEAEHAVQLGMDGKGDGVVRLKQRGHGRILRWYQKMAGFVRFSGTMRSI